MKKKVWIIVAGCGVLCAIGCAIALGSGFMKKQAPILYLTRALRNTVKETKPSPESPARLLTDLYNGIWRQDITIGVSRLKQNAFGLDPVYLSFVEVMTVRNTSVKDTANRLLHNNLSLRLAVSALADVNFRVEPNKLSFNIPQAFEYFVTVDPHHLSEEWDKALPGIYFGPLKQLLPFFTDGAFVHYYELSLLAPSFKLPKLTDFTDDIGSLMDDAQVEYMGKQPLTREGDSEAGSEGSLICDTYRLQISEASLNRYWRQIYADSPDGGLLFDTVSSMVDGIAFGDDLVILLYIRGGRIIAIDISMNMLFNGEGWLCGAAIGFDSGAAPFNAINAVIGFRNEEYGELILRCGMESEFGSAGKLFNQTRIEITYPRGNSETLEWQLDWDKRERYGDNFTVSVKDSFKDHDWEVNIAGTVIDNYEVPFLDADFRIVSFVMDWPDILVDILLNVKYTLRKENGLLDIEQAEERPLREINEFDILFDIYPRLLDDPQLGPLIREAFK